LPQLRQFPGQHRPHDDDLPVGLLKDKKAASFVTIGEPDIRLKTESGKQKAEMTATQEIVGLDIYDPMGTKAESRGMFTTSLIGWTTITTLNLLRQVFCGGTKIRGMETRPEPTSPKPPQKESRADVESRN
jgi:adenine-specific DNA-methyltransferase